MRHALIRPEARDTSDVAIGAFAHRLSWTSDHTPSGCWSRERMTFPVPSQLAAQTESRGRDIDAACNGPEVGDDRLDVLAAGVDLERVLLKVAKLGPQCFEDSSAPRPPLGCTHRTKRALVVVEGRLWSDETVLGREDPPAKPGRLHMRPTLAEQR